uniref:Uncharacterized protein n=1 Tax=Plectus sambesii TaxID=2011161 RepID=A0A914XR37_9BILA
MERLQKRGVAGGDSWASLSRQVDDRRSQVQRVAATVPRAISRSTTHPAGQRAQYMRPRTSILIRQSAAVHFEIMMPIAEFDENQNYDEYYMDDDDCLSDIEEEPAVRFSFLRSEKKLNE